jgi:hypothetical protein
MPDEHRRPAKPNDANLHLKRENICSNPLASWMRTSCSLSERDRRARCILIGLRLSEKRAEWSWFLSVTQAIDDLYSDMIRKQLLLVQR